MAGFSLRGDNYTGMLTRSIVFSAALFVFLAGEESRLRNMDYRLMYNKGPA